MPNVDCESLWILWWHGCALQQFPPLYLVKERIEDVYLVKERQLVHKAASVMAYFVDFCATRASRSTKLLLRAVRDGTATANISRETFREVYLPALTSLYSKRGKPVPGRTTKLKYTTVLNYILEVNATL